MSDSPEARCGRAIARLQYRYLEVYDGDFSRRFVSCAIASIVDRTLHRAIHNIREQVGALAIRAAL